MNSTTNIRVRDKHGFHYDIAVKHEYALGYSMAYYQERPIADVEYGRMTQPHSDDDSEWERYEESCVEWQQRAATDLMPKLEQYFNNQTP